MSQVIKQALVEELNRADDPTIAICGDITTKGDLEAYKTGVSYLSSILNDPGVSKPPTHEQIMLVPGNHDIDYRGAAKFVSFDDTDRFQALADICSFSGLGNVLAVKPREIITLSSLSGLSLTGINTCRGTGAVRRSLGGASRDQVVEALAARLDLADSELSQALEDDGVDLEEVLDVPSVHPEDLSKLLSNIRQAHPKTLPVVLGHHGLLPQHTPRLNPYTEMVNAGQVRLELQKLNRPILYLHGHVHKHVVETIASPRSGVMTGTRNAVISVAAPLLSTGFNRIAIKFDADGHPLGLEITMFRLGEGETTVTAEPERIHVSLRHGGHRDSIERSLMEFVLRKVSVTGAEIMAHIATTGLACDSVKAESFMERLYWLGHVVHTEFDSQEFEQMGYQLS